MEALRQRLVEILDEPKILEFENRERVGGRLHLLADLLKPNDDNAQLRSNVLVALEACMLKNPDWVRSKAPELVSDDVTSTSACVAEILAYGAMLRSSLDVEPIPTGKGRTSDYLVKLTNEDVLIEVHAKQYNNRTVDSLKEFHKETENFVLEEPGVYTFSHVVVPFGEPKPGESTTENAISKLSATKQNEGQADESRPSVLWLDFQDPIWSLVISPSQAMPLRYSGESFQSGEFWYAFYGYKGMPIFEDYHLGMYGRQIRMRHYGKFRNGSKFCACAVNTRHGLFLLENPWAAHPLPGHFVEKVLLMQGFNFICSWLNWPDGHLRERIRNEYIRVAALEAYDRG